MPQEAAIGRARFGPPSQIGKSRWKVTLGRDLARMADMPEFLSLSRARLLLACTGGELFQVQIDIVVASAETAHQLATVVGIVEMPRPCSCRPARGASAVAENGRAHD